MSTPHTAFMHQALALAKRAAKKGEVPIAALVVQQGKVIARAYNQREKKCDATAHAEILAIARACKKIGDWRLSGCQLYVTMEPCLMCFGAAVQARIQTIVYGCRNEKNPKLLRTIYQQWPKGPTMVGDVEAAVVVQTLSGFFKKLRAG